MSGLIIAEKSLLKALKAVIRIKQSVRKPGLRSNWFGGGPVFVLSEASDVSAMLTLIEVSSKVSVIASHGLPPGIRR